MKKKIKPIPGDPMTSYECMTIFSRKDEKTLVSYSGKSISKVYGSVGEHFFKNHWVLFSKEGTYIDHDRVLEDLIRRNKIFLQD